MNRTTFDPSRRVDIYLRVNRVGSKTFVFSNRAGADYSLIYLDFELNIKRNQGDKKNLISLDLNSGLTISNGNQLTAALTAAQTNINEGEYYWELYRSDIGKTWLNGLAIFHNGLFDGVNNDE